MNKGKEFSKDREFAVILEKVHSDIKIICEDLSTLKSRVEGIATNQAATLERVTSLEINVRKIQADIAEIKTDFSKRISRLEALK